jgi:hypothetical protein
MSTANKLATRFENLKYQKPANVASNIKKQLTEFKDSLPIIRAFCNPGLQGRHIEQIVEVSML